MINHFVLQGRLTRDPELRQTKSGIQVCGFTVVWSEKYKETETQLFMDCNAWRGIGEMISRNFSKGKEIIVEGKLSARSYTTKDGRDAKKIEMAVERVHFCGPKQSGESRPSVPEPQGFAEIPDSYESELPF